jgi:hypothetical protein
VRSRRRTAVWSGAGDASTQTSSLSKKLDRSRGRDKLRADRRSSARRMDAQWGRPAMGTSGTALPGCESSGLAHAQQDERQRASQSIVLLPSNSFGSSPHRGRLASAHEVPAAAGLRSGARCVVKALRPSEWSLSAPTASECSTGVIHSRSAECAHSLLSPSRSRPSRLRSKVEIRPPPPARDRGAHAPNSRMHTVSAPRAGSKGNPRDSPRGNCAPAGDRRTEPLLPQSSACRLFCGRIETAFQDCSTTMHT